MKILNEQNIGVRQDSSVGQASQTANVKNFHELTPGDRFKATVTDIQQGQVTIRLNSGQTLTAKSLILPEARIGEESIFMVKENFKGQILLEMVKPDNESLKSSFIREALVGAGQPVTTENIDLVRALMERQLPIDGETIQKALFFKYAQGESLSLDKVLFLVEENFPADKLNIELLNNLMEKHVGLKENISSLAYEILDIPDTALQKQLVSRIADGVSFSGDSETVLLPEEALPSEELLSSKNAPSLETMLPNEAESFGEASANFHTDGQKALKELVGLIREKLYFHLDEKKSVEDLQRYFKEVYETVKDMRETIDNMAAEKPEAVLQRLTAIQESLEFMNHIGQYKEYLQLPFVFADRENEGELVIFKNPEKQANNNEQASVLIGLDCAYLGRVEVFISKLKNTLNLQFRLGKDETLKNMNQNFHGLTAALSEKGYLVTGISFKKLTQPFQITSKANWEAPKKETTVPRRYSFDMRV